MEAAQEGLVPLEAFVAPDGLLGLVQLLGLAAVEQVAAADAALDLAEVVAVE